MKCPECREAVWVNYRTGKKICEECGVVINDSDFRQTESGENMEQ